MKISEVDSKVGAKGRGGASGKPTKKIAMATPGEGKITKQRGAVSARSAAHDADAQQFTGGGVAAEHPYDDSTQFGGAGGGSNGDE